MQTVYLDDYGFVPDIIGTACANSLRLKDVDFRVPCGKCIPCQKKRRSDWSLRLEHEWLFSDSAFFITLTYNDDYLPYKYWTNKYEYEVDKITKQKKRVKQWRELKDSKYPTLNTKHVQDYIKRLRKEHSKYGKKNNIKQRTLRYYAVGEYGTKTRRPHYHVLLFNMDIDNITPIANQWKYGFVDIGKDPKTGQYGGVTGASINYVTKYMFKDFNAKRDTRQRPFSLMSRKPIIGAEYLNQYGTHHIDTESLEVRDNKGHMRRLPRTYLRKLFTNQEDRIELSRRSYEKHIDKKLKAFEKKVEENYGGDVLEYQRSKDADLKRHRHTINNNETL